MTLRERLVQDEITSLRARVVDLTARVAVLETVIADIRRALGTSFDTETRKFWLDFVDSLTSLPSSPTPGEAWRAMVQTVEKGVALLERLKATAPQRTKDMRELHDVAPVTWEQSDALMVEMRAALAAARAVVGT